MTSHPLSHPASHPPSHPPSEQPIGAGGPPRLRKRLATGLAGVAVTAAFSGLPGGPLAPSAAYAAALQPDRVTVTAAGSPAYRLDADVTGGGVVVTDAVADYNTDKIQGQATLPGSAGGNATANFQITRGSFGGLSGTFTLQDTTAGVQISANVSGNVQAPTDGTVTWQGTATVRRGTQSSNQTVTFTVQDRRPDPGNHAIHITHAGQARTAILRLPDNYTGAPLPSLFHFPGLYETPSLAEFFGRMADHAQTNGYIMITPEHYGSGWQGVTGGPASPNVDDPGFVTKLQDTLIQRFNADPRRLYASGMSNGGFFTSKMGCDNKRFAAYAPVSGQLNNSGACRPGRNIPIALIHGDGDPIVSYNTAPTAAQFWARNNRCGTTTTDTDLPNTHPEDNTTVTRHVYNNCPSTAPVILYQIKGGGHNWPGGTPFLGPFLGGTTYDIDANTVIWNFVSQFQLP